MGRLAKITLWTVAVLVGLLALLVLVVALFDWNRLRPMVEEKASEALQRPVSIEGDLEVDWQWRDGFYRGPTSPPITLSPAIQRGSLRPKITWPKSKA